MATNLNPHIVCNKVGKILVGFLCIWLGYMIYLHHNAPTNTIVCNGDYFVRVETNGEQIPLYDGSSQVVPCRNPSTL